MQFETLDYQVEDGILTLTLNRPERMNAFNGPMRRELIAAFDAADADDAVRVIIVTGAGRAFCAGADLEKGGDTFNRHTAPISLKARICVTAAAPYRCVSSSAPSRSSALSTARRWVSG